MERILLRPAEAGDLIGVSRSKIYQLLKSGELPAVRVGQRLRVPLRNLREWAERQVESEKHRSI